LFSATFNGVLPGPEAALAVLAPIGTRPLIAGDAVTLDASADAWNNDTSGTIVITMKGETATGMVSVVIGGGSNSGAIGTVADLHVSALFTCAVP
jgi:hypothetical protein